MSAPVVAQERPTEHKAQATQGWMWSEDAAEFVRWEGLQLRWRFIGERLWRKINVVADPAHAQTPETLRAELPEIVARLAASVLVEPREHGQEGGER